MVLATSKIPHLCANPVLICQVVWFAKIHQHAYSVTPATTLTPSPAKLVLLYQVAIPAYQVQYAPHVLVVTP